MTDVAVAAAAAAAAEADPPNGSEAEEERTPAQGGPDDGESSSTSGRELVVATAADTKPSALALPAYLPASCLAAILNFMEYAEVRRCLMAGKIIAVDAARHVETLNIMNTSELVPSAARRFANVTEVNILSLVTHTPMPAVFDEDTPEPEDTLSVGSVTRSVPFLISFQKLERAFLGGWQLSSSGRRFKLPYLAPACVEPKDHKTVFGGLVDHFCGAFQCRSLSPSLHLEGVFEGEQLPCHDEEEEEEVRCRRCWTAATSFPLQLVLEKIPESCNCALCLSYSDRIEALASRHDIRSLSQSQSQAVIKCFRALAGSMITWAHIYTYDGHGDRYDARKSFIERMKSQGGIITKNIPSGLNVRVFYISVEGMEVLNRFASFIGPSIMNSKHKIFSSSADEEGKKYVLARQTFESLVQLNFDLVSKNFILVDPFDEAALQSSGLFGELRPEE